jgi:hypothetical protein
LVWAGPAVGLAAALTFAIWVIANFPILHVSRDQIRVQRHGEVVRVIERVEMDAVYQHRSKLIVETGAGRKLFGDEIEGAERSSGTPSSTTATSGRDLAANQPRGTSS